MQENQPFPDRQTNPPTQQPWRNRCILLKRIQTMQPLPHIPHEKRIHKGTGRARRTHVSYLPLGSIPLHDCWMTGLAIPLTHASQTSGNNALQEDVIYDMLDFLSRSFGGWGEEIGKSTGAWLA